MINEFGIPRKTNNIVENWFGSLKKNTINYTKVSCSELMHALYNRVEAIGLKYYFNNSEAKLNTVAQRSQNEPVEKWKVGQRASINKKLKNKSKSVLI